VNQREKAALKH